MSKKNRTTKAVVAAAVAADRETPAVTPTPAAVASAATTPKDSIRRTIREGLLAGQSTADITATVKEKFPQSQAAAKPAKHIAFYRSHMKKAGELPVTAAE